MPGSVRLSINVNPETATAIRAISLNRGESATETVRRAVAVLDLVERETAAGTRVELHGAAGVRVVDLTAPALAEEEASDAR